MSHIIKDIVFEVDTDKPNSHVLMTVDQNWYFTVDRKKLELALESVSVPAKEVTPEAAFGNAAEVLKKSGIFDFDVDDVLKVAKYLKGANNGS